MNNLILNKHLKDKILLNHNIFNLLHLLLMIIYHFLKIIYFSFYHYAIFLFLIHNQFLHMFIYEFQ